MTVFAIDDASVRDVTGLCKNTVAREVTGYALEIGCSVRDAAAAYSHAITADDTFTAVRIGRARARTLRQRALNPTPDAA